ncbi:MAG: hypothetical protein OEY91_03990 [Nitrospirota bacterium]|nr:hypothetical protein [Nitrospirota bacterium]
MSSISNILSRFPDFQQLSPNTSFAVKTQQFQAQAQISTASNFSFTTAEGDRVSLSTGSESNFSFESYNFQGLAGGQAVDVRNQQLSTSARSEFSLLIEGDLNEQELADIQAFLESAKGILQEISAGNVENAPEAAISLSELDFLSSAALFFQQTASVSLEFSSTQLSVQGEAHSGDARQRGFNAERGQGHTIEHIVNKIRKAQEKFQIDPEKLAKRLPRLLTKLVETLGKPASKEEASPSLFDQIRKEFFPSLLQATQTQPTDPETPDELAGDSDNPDPNTTTPQPAETSDKILTNLLKESADI